MSLHTAIVACRFLHDAATVFLWGAYGYLWTCVPPRLADDMAIRLRVYAIAAATVVFVTAILILPIRTAMIGDGWQDAIAPEMLWAVISATSVGQAWIVDFGASALLVGLLFVRQARRPAAITVASGLVLSSLILTGHAMMHEGWVGYFQQGNDLLHVLASGAWVGALVPLLSVLRDIAPDADADDRFVALGRFSSAGRLAVVIILVSGLINTLLIVGHLPTRWSSTYQVLLTIKIVFVLGMIGLASRNHFVLSPQLKHDRLAAAQAIRTAIVWEIALGVGAIALVAAFGMMDPH